jgi:hypothetical protein
MVGALLFFARTINRQVPGLRAPIWQTKIGWNELQYGCIVSAFQGGICSWDSTDGPPVDRIGTRRHWVLPSWVLRSGFGESDIFNQNHCEIVSRNKRCQAQRFSTLEPMWMLPVASLVLPWMALKLGWRFAFWFTSGAP